MVIRIGIDIGIACVIYFANKLSGFNMITPVLNGLTK